MKKNWSKTVFVLLLAALLCTLPGTLALADGTDVSAIQSDTPSGIQTGETDSGGSAGTGTSGGESGGEGSGTSSETGGVAAGTSSGTSTETGAASGSESGGSSTEAGNAAGGDASGTSTETPTTSGTESGASSAETGSTSANEPGAASTGAGSGTSTEATPTPAPTPTTAPTPTPAPTQTPTPSRPVVLKDPTDETVDVGGDCWFIADYSNALYAVWHFVSPDGKTDYRYDDQAVATAFPGLRIENGDHSNLHLLNIPAEMNGWRACCEYRNNTGSTRTNYAVVRVNGAAAVNPSPSPSSAPTATPTAAPTPTPSPSAAATPSPSLETSPNLQVSPTPETAEQPAAPLNRGGKIFLLFGAVAVVIGAAAIGTILLVSRRTSEKEAYTYKTGSRRRK